ncbi:MAG: hypothetical protein NXI04_08810 [Planctomycetaceae bacterium]|nr:hypothetical protein [Planctomycetaceae bacterium]
MKHSRYMMAAVLVLGMLVSGCAQGRWPGSGCQCAPAGGSAGSAPLYGGGGAVPGSYAPPPAGGYGDFQGSGSR